MRLWIDDERPMPKEFDTWAKSSSEAILALENMIHCVPGFDEPFEIASFDHDLSHTVEHDDESRPVLLWMIENNVWPDEIRVHTANPVGHKWLVGTAQRYAPPTTFVDPRNPWK